MALSTRGLSPKLLKNLRSPFNFAPSTFTAAPVAHPLYFNEKAGLLPPTITYQATCADTDKPTVSSANSILNFENVEELFSPISTGKLLRSSVTLHMAAFEPMVDIGMWVMNSRIMEMAILRDIILGTVKHTFFKHFCAGSDMKEVGRTVMKLRDVGLKGMLNYGLEHADDNQSCDWNMEEVIQTVKSANTLPPSSVSFIVLKITAISPVSLLKRVSDLLRWEYKDPSFHLPWKMNTLPIFSKSSPLYHTPNKPEPLNSEEERDLQLAHQRLEKICNQCLEDNVPLLIDAEDTLIQPAIDYFAYSAAIKHKKDDNPIVFGTIQAYLKDARERLLQVKRAADKMGVPVGFKLVRGAYMSSERQLAEALGVESPVHNTIKDTHACYNDCASYMLEEVANGTGSLILATHNIDSGKLAAKRARDLGIKKEDERLQFAQLYGMAESLSLSLRNAGFQGSKYLPFGPVEQIMPYLLRRAEENRCLLSSSYLDRLLMGKELKRRLKATIV